MGKLELRLSESLGVAIARTNINYITKKEVVAYHISVDATTSFSI